MITLSIDEKDVHVLRVSASYLLALAGDDLATEATATPRAVSAEDVREYSNLMQIPMEDAKQVLLNNPGFKVQTFTAAELAEAAALPATIEPSTPSPASVFGASPNVPAVVPSIVAAVPSPTAPEAATAITSTATPNVPVPPAPTPANTAAPVAPPTASPAHGVELDARGLPWDSRIHSRGKTKNAQGEWKKSRGIDPHLLARIEKELYALMAIPAQPSPPAASATVPLPPSANTGIPTPPSPTVTTASPSNLPPFPALMMKVSAANTAGTLSQAEVVDVVKSAGLQSLPQLISRPDLIPAIEAQIDAIIASKALA